MGTSTIATFLILTTLIVILSSLGFGLFYLLRDGTGSRRTIKSLTIRVGLTMTLFLGMILAVHQGWIIPNPPPL